MAYHLRIAQLAILSKTWATTALTQGDRVRIRITGAIAGETMIELEAQENFDLALARGSSYRPKLAHHAVVRVWALMNCCR